MTSAKLQRIGAHWSNSAQFSPHSARIWPNSGEIGLYPACAQGVAGTMCLPPPVGSPQTMGEPWDRRRRPTRPSQRRPHRSSQPRGPPRPPGRHVWPRQGRRNRGRADVEHLFGGGDPPTHAVLSIAALCLVYVCFPPPQFAPRQVGRHRAKFGPSLADAYTGVWSSKDGAAGGAKTAPANGAPPLLKPYASVLGGGGG